MSSVYPSRRAERVLQSGIYEIVNTVNGKKYIGSAVDLNDRLSHHKTSLRSNKHRNPHLQRAWKKYGENAFVFSVIEPVANPLNLVGREQHHIDSFAFDQLYNICPTSGSMLGFKHSAETKRRMREVHKGKVSGNKGKKMSEEARRKMSEAHKGERNHNFGKTLSTQTREKISEANKGKASWNKGKPHSESAKQKMSERKKGKPSNRKGAVLSEENKKRISATLRDRKLNNTSGYVGVCFGKAANKWIASIRYMGKQQHIGYFLTKREAVKARNVFIAKHGLPNKIQVNND